MDFSRYLEKFEYTQGHGDSSKLKAMLPDQIPQDYIEFLSAYDGGEGFIGEEYVRLYKAEELRQLNSDYKVAELVPGIFIFGTNGASEALAFDLRGKKPKYVMIPFMFEYNAIIVLGASMHEFLERIFTQGFFI